MTEHKEKAQLPGMTSSFALGFIVLFLVIDILQMAQAIMIPFVMAVFVWYLINAIARALEKTSFRGQHLTRFACFFLALFSLAFGMFLVFEIVSHNLSKVIQAAPIYQRNFESLIPQFINFFHLEGHALTVRDLLQYIDVGTTITVLAKIFTGFAGKTLIILFYVGFLLYEQRFFKHKITEMIRDGKREALVHQALNNIDTKIRQYIGVKSFVSSIDSILTFSILSLFNLNFAGFWGLMAFFLHFIPYAGSFIALTLPTTIALIQYGDPTIAFAVLASLSISHVFIGQFLDPYLMGNSLNLSPIFIISSLAMWGMIWGVPGMFLAVPILTTLVIVLAQFPRTRSLAVLLSKTGNIEKSKE